MTEFHFDRAAINRLLRPKSVAIVGASPTPGALGAAVLSNLERAAFAGEIYLINPKRDEISGRKCLKSPDELPLGVDVAVLAIPRAGVLAAVKQLAQRKVHAIVIFSAGFAEGGESGAAEQREIGEIAREHGIVIEGPNCLGMVNYVDGTPLTFVEAPPTRLGPRRGAGIVSQSGAMAIVLSVTLASRDLAISYSISTGNEAATGVEDYVEHLVEEAGTSVIGMIVEQFRKPKRFLQAAERARRAGKPIILLHPGRSTAARESAATHTGAMVGDYAVMRTMVERAGVVLVHNLEELGDVHELALRCPSLPKGAAAVLTDSGAFKALTLDLCEQIKLSLPILTDATAPLLRAAMPDFVPVSNPLDLTAQALVDPDLYKRTISALVSDERFGCIVLGIIQTDHRTSDIKFPPIIAAIRELRTTKPIIFAGLDEGAPVPPAYVQELRSLGVPYFPSPDRAFRAIARLTEMAGRDASRSTDLRGPSLELPRLPGVVPEHQAKALLRQIGIPFPIGHFAPTLEDATRAADTMGYPVVLKAQAAALSHKSDAGGVILNLDNASALARGWRELYGNIAKHRPGMLLDGVLVEKMGKRGTELIIGARNDPEWGPVILAGFGGVTAEILHDFKLIPADTTVAAITRELDSLGQAPLLRGYRGSPALDVPAVAELIAKLGRLVLDEPAIQEVDLNPVVVYPVGEGAVALDALIVMGSIP